MFKLVLVGLVFVGLCEAAISSLQLVLPDDTYSVLAGGKSSSNTLGNSIPSLSNAISEEEKSSIAVSEESTESGANSASSPAPNAASTASPEGAAGSVPAALSRVKPAATLNAITSTTGLARAALVISSSAQASATANSPASQSTSSSNSPITSVRSSATVQHRILPAETIPLPITISTRPGLRTVIAPETITIQQPAVAKVGEVVQHIPTAVSHQRQTVVHNHARVVTPIVAPAVRTLTSQIVRAYHTPLVYAPHVVEN